MPYVLEHSGPQDETTQASVIDYTINDFSRKF